MIDVLEFIFARINIVRYILLYLYYQQRIDHVRNYYIPEKNEVL